MEHTSVLPLDSCVGLSLKQKSRSKGQVMRVPSQMVEGTVLKGLYLGGRHSLRHTYAIKYVLKTKDYH